MRLFLATLLALLLVPAFGQYTKTNVSPTEEAKNLKLLIQKQSSTKATYLKNKANAKAKKQYVDASVALGLQYTFSNTVDRTVKYKKALTYFREARKTDPNNAVAKEWIERIESIYKSMNRPIPH